MRKLGMLVSSCVDFFCNCVDLCSILGERTRWIAQTALLRIRELFLAVESVVLI